ncbi:MAG: RNA pseudouridine synthase [Flammeovirgaceae bacterium]|nr:RNA pseudouridine synthase [Flammeovirgaceae bacterium]MBE63732.1 RNA pseudouridine synthase [Flammeovirgaceae bacterium]HCX23787.1 RNA pseudouridine synthase [Cytophagales bacterium]
MKDPQVIYEDNHLLLLNKPSGWLVQGDKTGDKTLTDWGRAYIKRKYNKPGDVFLHPTHRLDRPVSGITVFARTSKALERMNKLFREDKVQKTYLAVVGNKPPAQSGKLVHWLYKDTKKNMVKAYNKPMGSAKEAELEYDLLGNDDGHSLLKVMPKTGRPHQIRVQLATMKTRIKGDLKYGYPEANPDKSIHLHAFQISFVHPVQKELVTYTCTPKWHEFKHQIDGLGR